jgi:hypothetical protein
MSGSSPPRSGLSELTAATKSSVVKEQKAKVISVTHGITGFKGQPAQK